MKNLGEMMKSAQQMQDKMKSMQETLSKMEITDADVLFISCTALPVLDIIEKLEKKLNKPVLSSNQALIWDALEKIGKNNDIQGFGKLFSND